VETTINLDVPPKPTDGILAPVPIDTLQGWGLLCDVPPSEVTISALTSNKIQDDDATT
jgi:hypothetical protein